MHNVQIAEWILCLVTSRDRAASTVGDLMEANASGGTIGFWSRLLRIAASLLWTGIAENPVRNMRAGFVALAVDTASVALLSFLTGVLFFIEVRNGHPHVPSAWWTLWLYLPTFLLSLPIGRMLARLAPGRELPAYMAYAILGATLSLALTFIFPHGLSTSGLVSAFLIEFGLRTPVLAGAMWGRHRRLAAR